MSVTIALDVDGVVSPVTPVSNNRPAMSEHDLGCSYTYLPDIMTGALVSDDVVATLQRLHQKPEVTITWHTSWWDSASEDLAPALNLPSFSMFATDEEYADSSGKWWKLAAVERWLRQARPNETLIWIDDDIAEAKSLRDIPDWVLSDPRLITVSPSIRRGLTTGDLNFITSAVG